MKDEVKIKDALALYEVRKPRACAVRKSGSVDPCYGLDVVFLDDKDVKDLKDGKVLYYDDGEYAHLIAFLEK